METWQDQATRILSALYVLTEGHLLNKEIIHAVFIEAGVRTEGISGSLKSLEETEAIRRRSTRECSLTAHGVDLVESAARLRCTSEPQDEDSSEICALMLQTSWERYLVLSSIHAGSRGRGIYTEIAADEREETDDDTARAIHYLLEKDWIETRGASGRFRLKTEGRSTLDNLNERLRKVQLASPRKDRFQEFLLTSWARNPAEGGLLERLESDVRHGQTRSEGIMPSQVIEDGVHCRAITRQGIVEVGRIEYDLHLSEWKDYDIFVDLTRRVWHLGKERKRLTQREYTMIRQYLETRRAMRPKETEAGKMCLSQRAARKCFEEARRKLLPKNKSEVFQRYDAEDDYTAYEFSPSPDLRYCLLYIPAPD